jgi:hypothetical protein
VIPCQGPRGARAKPGEACQPSAMHAPFPDPVGDGDAIDVDGHSAHASFDHRLDVGDYSRGLIELRRDHGQGDVHIGVRRLVQELLGGVEQCGVGDARAADGGGCGGGQGMAPCGLPACPLSWYCLNILCSQSKYLF